MTNIYSNVFETDVLVVGSEGAGGRAAVEIARNGLRVIVATKGVFTKSGATVTADMDIDVPSSTLRDYFGLSGGDSRDTEENFMADMLMEGKYMNNEGVVWAHCSNAAKYVKELVDWGMKVQGLIHSPGHRYPRGIVSTGRSMVTAIKNAVKKERIDFVEQVMVTHVLTNHGQTAGAAGIHIPTGNFYIFKAKAVIIATGGAMRIYPRTTAPQELTGDGMVMALKVGAELVDMEFPLFLPACLVWPESMLGSPLPYTTSTVIGAWWLNKYGQRFMTKWDPRRMEHGTTRDVGSIAQMMEILEGRGSPHGGIYVSYKHLPEELIEWSGKWNAWWPNMTYGNFKLDEINMDPRKVAYEAAPAAHYWNGGIKINGWGETRVPGLYAAGEVQGGTMGANRLSGNAVTECVVFGALAGIKASAYAKSASSSEIVKSQVEQYYEELHAPLNNKDGLNVVETRKKIQDLGYKYAGPIRTEEGLLTLKAELDKIKNQPVACKAKTKIYNRDWFEALEIDSMVRVMETIVQASLMRKESRGAMYRLDYPDTDNENWLKNIIISYKGDRVSLRAEDVKATRVQLPERKKIPYMISEWDFEQHGGESRE